MKVINFYREESGNSDGHMLTEILGWSNGAWELEHNYIQWIFPSNEMSMLNGDAPTMTREESDLFFADPELSKKVEQSFYKFLDFLGFKIVIEDSVGSIVSKTGDVPEALSYFNHNFLRITRCLKSLRLTNNELLAKEFFDMLKTYKPLVSVNTWWYWENAATKPLWN